MGLRIIRVFMVALLAGQAGQARAAVVSWASPVSGAWSDGDRWSGGSPPGPADDARIVVSGSGYRVTLDVDATVKSLTLGNGATPCSLLAEGRAFVMADSSTVRGQGVFITRNSVSVRGLISLGTGMRFVNMGQVFLRHSSATLAMGAQVRNAGEFICTRTCSLKGPGDFDNEVAGTLVVSGLGADGRLVSAADLTNAGTIQLTDLDTTGDFAASIAIPGGTLTNSVGATISALNGTGSGDARAIEARLVNQGLLETILPGHTLELDRPSADHVNTGRIDVSAGTLLVTQSGATPTFTNSGRVEIMGGGTIRVAGMDPDYRQSAGRTILHTGSSLDADRDVRICGGTLEGSGTVSGDVFICGGRLTPGASAGSLEFTDGYTQEPDGSLVFELGPLLYSVYDTVTVVGHADLAGSLLVRFLPGITPSAGDSYPVFIFGSRSGTFDVFQFETRSAVSLIDTVFTPTLMSLELLSDFASVHTRADSGAALMDAFSGHSRPDGSGFFRLALAAPSRVVITVFDVSGRRIATLVDAPLPAGRYEYPFGASGTPGDGLPSGVYFARAEAVRQTARVTRGARAVLVR